MDNKVLKLKKEKKPNFKAQLVGSLYLVPIIAILALVFSPLFSTPEYLPSGDPEVLKPPPIGVQMEVLGQDEFRIDEKTKVKKIREFNQGGEPYSEYEVVISNLPVTMPDLRTLIVCEWRKGRDIDGVDYIESGNNLFYAKVTGTRISTEYNAVLASWDPQIFIGDEKASLTSGPKVIGDLINPDYKKNTVEWIYQIEGFSISRYLRQIEGLLIEFYVIEEDPGEDIRIVNNYEEDSKFEWETSLFAVDSMGRSLAIEGNAGEKILTSLELSNPNLVYPITIDPTISYTTSAYDGVIEGADDTSYNTAWADTSGGVVAGSSLFQVGQGYFDSPSWPFYFVDRGYVFFDTSAIPDTAVLQSAYLSTYISGTDSVIRNFRIQLQEEVPPNPHAPLSSTDYNKALYGTGFVGSSGYVVENGDTWLHSQIFEWELDDVIDVTGSTRLVLRSEWDIAGNEPYGFEFVNIRSYEYGSVYIPKLVVTYTVPLTPPSIASQNATSVVLTQATLNGYLSNDGGADCSLRFRYGTTDSYGSFTSWVGGKSTGDSLSSTVQGLDSGTLYHFTLQAENSEGISTSDDQTFLTVPGPVTNFTATSGDTQVTLNWTVGVNSNKTMVRRGTSGYPASESEGTQVYFASGNSTIDGSLTNGTTYYYSAFSEVTGGVWQQYSTTTAVTSSVPSAAGPPFVTTWAATSVGSTTATLQGYLDSLQGYEGADCYFQYYWGGGTWTDNPTASVNLTSPGPFSKAISGLPADTLIHARAVADNGDVGAPTYGSDVPFTTGQASAPEMTTSVATGVTRTSSTLHGTVTNDGGASVTAWFEYGLTEAPGYETSTVTGLETGQQVYTALVGLEYSTKYYFRIVGQNSIDYGYGAWFNFTTLDPVAPTVSTINATKVGATTATLRGSLLTDGGVPCNVRFQHSVSGNFTGEEVDTPWITDIIAGQSFEYPVANLTTNQLYYFRAQALNGGGTAYGDSQSFLPVLTAPTNFQALASTSTTIYLSWEVQGDKTLVIGKVGSFPADRNDGDQIYFGPDTSAGHFNLLVGTNYYYRAWSWQEGDTYSADYAQDAATTPARADPSGTVPSTGGRDIETPGLPNWLFGAPSSARISSWPGVGLINSTASDLGMPEGSMWVLVCSILLLIFGIVIFVLSRSLMFVLGFIGFLLIIFSMMGIMAGWVVILYFVLAGGSSYVFTKI